MQWHYDLKKDDICKEITQQVSAVTFLQRTVQELKRKTEKGCQGKPREY